MKRIVSLLFLSLAMPLCADVTDDIRYDPDGTILYLAPGKVYDEFVLDRPVSVEGHRVGGEKVGAFGGVTIRRLKVVGRRAGVRGGVERLPCEVFRGVMGLEEIEFVGEIPEMETDRNLLWGEQSEWRKSLRRIVVGSDAGPSTLSRLGFIGDIKCIEFACSDQGCQLKYWNRDELAGASSLEKVVVPYELATNRMIRWSAILSGTKLRGREVVSERNSAADSGNEVVLLQMKDGGTVSDAVTDIRKDAVADFKGARIEMPFSARRFLEVRKYDKSAFEANLAKLMLKRDSVSFYPEIDAERPSARRRFESSRSAFADFPVKVSTAYAGLRIEAQDASSVSLTTNCTSFGNAYVTGFSLRRWSRDDLDDAALDAYRGRSADAAKWEAQRLRFASKVRMYLELDGRLYRVGYERRRGQRCPPVREIVVDFKAPVGNYLGKAVLAGLLGLFLVAGSLFALLRYSPRVRACSLRASVIAGFAAFGIVIAAFGGFGILQDCVDRWIMRDVFSYLNSSFISSLVISVSMSVAQMFIGVLQGIQVAPLGVGVDFGGMLEPVQRMLDRITTFSWLATAVLGFIRIVCQLLRDAGDALWMTLGAALAVYPAVCLHRRTRPVARLVGVILALAVYLAVVLPLILWGCSAVSGRLMAIAGGAFGEAVASFGCLAESFSWGSLMSLSSVQMLLEEFTAAAAQLMSASVYYMATKLFDCFAVPLIVYISLRRALKGLGRGDRWK